MFTPRYSCVESQAIISADKFFARAMASADLPDAVGPTITTSGSSGNSKLFMERKCGGRGRTRSAVPRKPAASCRESVGAAVSRSSLIGGFEGQIVQEIKAQFDVRAAEGGGKRFERIGGAYCGHRSAIEGFFPGAQQARGLAGGHAAVAHNAELQGHAPAIAELRGLRHHRIPVAAHAGDHAGHVITEVHTFRGSENFVTVSVGARALASAAA